jgi:hypothetical protein
MAKHNYFDVVKRTDTPGPSYHIRELQPNGSMRTVAKSSSRVKANMSAGIRDSERTKGDG